jgi:hypothetical protein
MSVNLSPVGNGFQFFTNNGEPLVGGKLDTYQAGSTTPLTTYTDSSGLIANTNPIILGTDGRPPDTIWLSEGFFYKFVLSDADDVQIQVYDNLYGIINAQAPAATPIPSGGILLWSGSIGSIPAGYVLCNGNNSTPDLRDRFIVGAGSTYAVDATGGSADATLPTHTHTATVTDPGHGTRSQARSNLVAWKRSERLLSEEQWCCVPKFNKYSQNQPFTKCNMESRFLEQPLMLTQGPLAPTPTCLLTMHFAT